MNDKDQDNQGNFKLEKQKACALPMVGSVSSHSSTLAMLVTDRELD